MFKKSRNTLNKGQVRFILFKEDATWYGVALELNIVVNAESKFEASLELDSAVTSYINTARFSKVRHSVLNQEPSKEYSQLWKDLEAGKEPRVNKITEGDERKIMSSVKVASYGFLPQFA